MQTTGIGSGAPAAAPTEEKSGLGRDAFLRILLAQLGNQDPTAPMDSTDFVAQLAQFANVELLQGVEARLDALVVAQAASNQTAAANLVGREVVYHADEVALGPDGAVVHGQLAGAAASVTVTLTDEAGRTVRTLRLGPSPAGRIEIPWDGRDDDGAPLPPGDYRVRIAAADAEGKSVDVVSLARGVARGISFEHGYPELLVGDARVLLSDVLELHAS